MNKVRDFFEDAIWTIKAFIAQPIIPIVSLDYIKENAGSWNGNNAETDKYVFYEVNDKIVKVRAIEVLRDLVSEKQSRIYELEDVLADATK
jgi:hypothetical protein